MDNNETNRMREEQIKILEQMRDDYLKSQEDAISEAFERTSSETRDKLLAWSDDQKPKIDALTDAISYIRDTSEMLEAASFVIVHINGDEYAIEHTMAKWMYYKDGPTKTDPLGDIKSGFDSALDAYREVKEKQ
jgi:hypothetical protein